MWLKEHKYTENTQDRITMHAWTRVNWEVRRKELHLIKTKVLELIMFQKQENRAVV